MNFSREDLLPYITFKASRSGGKGGQNVNKVSSKVELNFDLQQADIFSEEQKRRIGEKLVNRLTASRMIQVVSEEERSQLLNKERSLDKLNHLLVMALHVPKRRKATKPSKASVERRLKDKQQKAFKKLSRQKKGFEG